MSDLFRNHIVGFSTRWLRIPSVTVQPEMELKPNCGSDRAWVWTSTSDFADGEPKPELLAIRFANAESKSFYLCNRHRAYVTVACLNI